MKYIVFGKTGLQVSQLALGTGNFGTGWGHGADARESEAIFNAYAEAGGNFIDTADIPIAAAQFQHSLVHRVPEGDLFPACEALGLGVVTWSSRR